MFDELPVIHDFSEFKTIGKLVSDHPDMLTENRVRWLLRDREENGLEKAVMKVGNQIHIHEPRFLYLLCKRAWK